MLLSDRTCQAILAMPMSLGQGSQICCLVSKKSVLIVSCTLLKPYRIAEISI